MYNDINETGIDKMKLFDNSDSDKSFLLDDNEVTILVLAYNRLEKTRLCIENILEYTKNIPYRLILVDNGSEKENVLEYFQSVNYENKDIVVVKKNISGVFGLNLGLMEIKTKYCAVVTNDIIVTPNWLENLCACANSDDRIGMVCPTSTAISNHQLETLGGFDSIEEMQLKAGEFNKSDAHLWEECIRLIPSATLYRTEIFQKIGLYDLDFVHDFGDDDFSFRVRRGGYRLMLCRDTFVHHAHGSRDVSGEEKKKIEKISVDGLERFIKKYHGIDPWKDADIHIDHFLNQVHWENIRTENVLVLHPKCGVPVLDIKNVLKHYDKYCNKITSYETESKYYVDLSTVSDEVSIGDMGSYLSNLNMQKYDVLIACKEINFWKSPFEELRMLFDQLNDHGVMFFCVRNTYDYKAFLCMLNENSLRELEQPKVICIEDVILYLRELKAKEIVPQYDFHLPDENIENIMTEAIKRIIDVKEVDNLVSRLFVKNYWFICYK